MMAFDKWMLHYSALILLVFRIGNIDAQDCGGNYTTNHGVFTSPNYPEIYNLSSTCTYRISLSTISSITLSFETFELDRSSDDYVSITCESNNSSVPIIYYWNSEILPISLPWCSSGMLYLFSDFSRNHNYTTRGFKVQYQVSTKDCGNTVFTSSNGTISWPNFPQNYSNYENCTYSIWGNGSSSYTLSFQAFELESDCERNWVQIRCDNSGFLLPKYCGSTLPKPAYITNCNKVLIWFHTDHSNVSGGFSLHYSDSPDGCGKLNYAGLSGIITSPNYPMGYNSMFCNYYLYPVSYVALSFQSFDLGPFIDTEDGDYVKVDCIGYGNNDSHYYQGNSLPQMISYSLCRRVRIRFYTNNAISGTGFNIKYQVNPLVANSAITNAPKNFTVDVGSQVQLDCTSNATGYYPSWTLNKDGTDENTTVIASFCNCTIGYCSKYSFNTSGPGECNLVIRSATLAEAGIYTCIDVGLASLSAVVTIVVPTTAPTLSDQDVIVIILSVLLAICILGYIGVAVHFTVRRYRETSRVEEGQRNTTQDMRPANYSVETQATRPEYEGIPIFMIFSKREPEVTNTATDI